jgi:uncharacterized protein (TIGR03435 family)
MKRGLTLLFATSAALAQSQDARPTYEVASIKPNTSGDGHSVTNGDKGRIVFINQTLKRLLERAYNVGPFEVAGPDWMESLHFDIVAKYPPDSKKEDRALMLRTLLEDRFQLAVHRESKDLPGYALVLAKVALSAKGAPRTTEQSGNLPAPRSVLRELQKIKPVEPGASGIETKGGPIQTFTARKASMAQLADTLARRLDQPVIDKTGVAGVYDYELRFTSDDLAASATTADMPPTLFTALQETLGLRLQPEKVPVQIVVVDHLERLPTDN